MFDRANPGWNLGIPVYCQEIKVPLSEKVWMNLGESLGFSFELGKNTPLNEVNTL